MGKKNHVAGRNTGQPKSSLKFWCYYCNAESKDEAALLQHQASKHFKCPFCDKHAFGSQCLSLVGLVSHVRRSHRKELEKVPGAIDGRNDPEIIVHGMDGIPQDILEEMKAAGELEVELPAPPRVQPAPPQATVMSIPRASAMDHESHLENAQLLLLQQQQREVEMAAKEHTSTMSNMTVDSSTVDILTSGRLNAVAQAIVAAAATNTAMKTSALEASATMALLAAAVASTNTAPEEELLQQQMEGDRIRQESSFLARAMAEEATARQASDAAAAATAATGSSQEAPAKDAPKRPFFMSFGGAAAKSGDAVQKNTEGICGRIAANAKAFAVSRQVAGEMKAQQPPPKKVSKKQIEEDDVDALLARAQGQGYDVRGRERHPRDSRSRSRQPSHRYGGRSSDYGGSEGALQLAITPGSRGLGGMGMMGMMGSIANPSGAVMPYQQAPEPAVDEFSGGKQVACRSGWAHYVKPDGRYYYKNVLTGEKRRELPKNLIQGMRDRKKT